MDDRLRVVGVPDVWAGGDAAAVPDPHTESGFSPPTAQHATRQGTLIGRNVLASVTGEAERPFRYRTLGTLVSLGRSGYAALFERNIAFARTVAAFLRSHQAYDVLLPTAEEAPAFRQMNIVCFAPSARAPSRFLGKDGAAALIRAINGTRRVYVTGTTWRGRAAVRLAVSNWQTELERDWPVVRQVLNEVMQ